MEEQVQEGHDGPVLSDEGAALLANVVERHQSTSARRHDHRQQRDSLRRTTTAVVVNKDHDFSVPSNPPRPASRVPAVLLTLAFLGLLITGVAAGFLLTQDSDQLAIETEVAGTTEVPEPATTEGGSEPATLTDQDDPDVVPVDTGDAAGPVDDLGQEPVQDPILEDAAEAPPNLALAGIGLSVYDVDPANAGTRSFAIRISNDSGESVLSTEAFAIEIETPSGERIPALVRFVHESIPAGSSAIATVRVEGVPDGPATAVLVTGDTDIDLQELP